jgi:hypothetical protein
MRLPLSPNALQEAVRLSALAGVASKTEHASASAAKAREL